MWAWVSEIQLDNAVQMLRGREIEIVFLLSVLINLSKENIGSNLQLRNENRANAGTPIIHTN